MFRRWLRQEAVTGDGRNTCLLRLPLTCERYQWWISVLGEGHIRLMKVWKKWSKAVKWGLISYMECSLTARIRKWLNIETFWSRHLLRDSTIKFWRYSTKAGLNGLDILQQYHFVVRQKRLQKAGRAKNDNYFASKHKLSMKNSHQPKSFWGSRIKPRGTGGRLKKHLDISNAVSFGFT